MSLGLKLHSLRIDPDQEEAIGGWSKKGKKATRVENKGDNKKKESSQSKKATPVENKGDNKKKESSQSKKAATRVENKGENKKKESSQSKKATCVENKGDDKIEGGEGCGSQIDSDWEEAIGGWSKKGKKATRVENKRDNKKKESSQSKKATCVENEGDDKKKGGKGWGCQICSSTRHSTYNCSWIHRIPYDVVHIPELGPFWVITCMDCGNYKNYPENCKECPKCGCRDRFVSPKACVACNKRGHFDNYDEDCPYFGMRGENNPFRMMLKSALEKRGLDPKPYLASPYL